MANPEHLAIIRQGVGAWNRWRRSNPDIRPDLSGADLSRANLVDVNLSGANLAGASLIDTSLVGANLADAILDDADLTASNLYRAFLVRADLDQALLESADLTDADLSGASLDGAYLVGADLYGANLTQADLTGADLTRAGLRRVQLVETKVAEASLSGADIYGIAAWNVQGVPADQTDLVINPPNEPLVTVDDLEVAQFIYLMLNNEKLKRVIDTITSKVVLILGRFTPDRKVVLDALRDQLRMRNLTPVMFDFDVPADRNVRETVTLLARMARFIIADLTDPKSIPMELEAIAPQVAVPIQSIIHERQEPFSMFTSLNNYHWVLSPYEYGDLDDLLANLEAKVLAPAEEKRKELES